MKLKDITDRSPRWSTPSGTLDANAPATVLWILASLLILVLYPGCTAIENNRPIKLPSNVQASQAQKDDKTQWASNAQGTLFGENLGDSIVLNWELDGRAA